MTLPLERLRELAARHQEAVDGATRAGANESAVAYYQDSAEALEWAISIREAASRAPETPEEVADQVCARWQSHLTGEPLSMEALIAAALQREREIAEVRLAEERECVSAALEFAERYGGIDGDHHRMWVIDQMVRALTGPGYEQWVKEQRAGEEGPDTYDWSEGIAP